MKHTRIGIGQASTPKQLTFWKKSPIVPFTFRQLSHFAQQNNSESDLTREQNIPAKQLLPVKHLNFISFYNKENATNQFIKDLSYDHVDHFRKSKTIMGLGSSLMFLLSVTLKIDISVILPLYCVSVGFINRESIPKRVDPLTFTPFKQSDFSMSMKFLSEATYDKKGHCETHVIMWYYCQLSGINYIQELSLIQHLLENNQPLTGFQMKLLENIETLKSQPYRTSTFFLSGAVNHFLRQNIIQQAIDYAIKNPGKLISIFPSRNLQGKGVTMSHIIGIISNKDGEIKYFDPNMGEEVFQDAQLAKIKLSQLVAYQYAGQLPALTSLIIKETLDDTPTSDEIYTSQKP